MHHVVIVRRGQTETLSLLEEMFVAATAVIWDRRFGDRRRQHGEKRPDRRTHERRSHPPSSWTNLGFLVFEIPSGSQFRVGGTGSVHSLHPIQGDVLIARELHVEGVCTVSKVPEPVGTLFASYGRALEHALALVQSGAVNLWYTEDHKTFTLLQRSRPSG